jgi:hypothetical protein
LPMLDPQHQPLRSLLAYWRMKKGDRLTISRAEIDPGEIKSLLPHVGLVDIERAPLRFRYRLAGTEIIKGYGLEVTGRYLDQMDLNGHERDITAEYVRAAESGEPSCSTFDYVRRDGRHIRYERLVLPLSSDGNSVDMLFGGCVFDIALPAI